MYVITDLDTGEIMAKFEHDYGVFSWFYDYRVLHGDDGRRFKITVEN